MRVPQLNEKDLTHITQSVRELAEGNTNAIGGPFVLNNGPADETTLVTAPLCTLRSMVVLVPLTASAALTPIWVSGVFNGYFTVGHNISPATDRAFKYEIRRA